MGDASHPDNLKDVLSPHFADLIFCQHPQLFSNQGVLEMLKETVPHYLSDDGRVYISSISLKQHRQTEENKPEAKTALSYCSMFKETLMGGLSSLSQMSCCRKSRMKNS